MNECRVATRSTRHMKSGGRIRLCALIRSYSSTKTTHACLITIQSVASEASSMHDARLIQVHTLYIPKLSNVAHGACPDVQRVDDD